VHSAAVYMAVGRRGCAATELWRAPALDAKAGQCSDPRLLGPSTVIIVHSMLHLPLWVGRKSRGHACPASCLRGLAQAVGLMSLKAYGEGCHPAMKPGHAPTHHGPDSCQWLAADVLTCLQPRGSSMPAAGGAAQFWWVSTTVFLTNCPLEAVVTGLILGLGCVLPAFDTCCKSVCCAVCRKAHTSARPKSAPVPHPLPY